MSSAREARGLSREALASQLNMGLEQLEALETGNRSRLPETVFIVAQARRVASHLQQNIDGPIQALRRNLPAQGGPSTAGSSQTAAPRKVQAAGSSLAGAKAAAAQATAVNQAPRSSASGTAAQVGAGGSPLAGLARAMAWIALLAGLGSLAGLGWSRWQQSQRQPSTPSLSAQPASAPPGATPAAPATATATATATTAAASELVLSAPNGASWLAVETIEGESLFKGNFEGRRSFPIGRGLRVLAGRPDLVLVQPPGAAAAEPMGSIEDVRQRSYEPPAPSPTP
ncbi:MAG: helix-turn-helix transcriptional regulator [Prochlorococcaceae cyanobacterium]